MGRMQDEGLARVGRFSAHSRHFSRKEPRCDFTPRERLALSPLVPLTSSQPPSDASSWHARLQPTALPLIFQRLFLPHGPWTGCPLLPDQPCSGFRRSSLFFLTVAMKPLHSPSPQNRKAPQGCARSVQPPLFHNRRIVCLASRLRYEHAENRPWQLLRIS